MNRSFLQITGQGENRLYGHLSILAQYCKIKEANWLNGYLQHGWNGCDGFSNYAGSKRTSKKFIWSKRAQNDLISRGGSNSTVIGSPWLYNLKIQNKLTSNPVATSQKIIAYPLHSQPWAPKNYLHSEYAKYLKEKYGSVSVSLHWSEYSNNEIVQTYQNYGHSVLTNGVGTPWIPNFDKGFLDNQLAILQDHGMLVTNAMQTSVLYAMSLGLKIEFGGPASWVKKNDEIGTYGDYGQNYWQEKVITESDFTWKEELGFHYLYDPEDLKIHLGWNTSFKPNISFIFTRFLDILRDGSFTEKISYFLKGRR